MRTLFPRYSRWLLFACVTAIALTLSPNGRTQASGPVKGAVITRAVSPLRVVPAAVLPSSSLKVALIAADEGPYAPDAQAKLQATGRFSQVDLIDATNTTPSLAQLQAYDSVLVWGDFSFNDATTLGNNLANYIDGGGGVVVAVFANASVPIGGRFYSDDYYGIEPTGQNEDTELTLGTVYNPSSPLMTGVSSFDGGSSSFHSVGGVQAKAMRVADWSDGEPLVVTRVIKGVPRVDLNFWPPSSDARNDLWVSSTDGATLMANALQFVHPGSCAPAPASLLGWWKGEGDATDSQNSNDGVFNGTPAYAAGEVGQAFSFDGNAANFVLVQPNASLDLPQWTADAWIYPTTTSGIRYILDKGAQNLGENYLLSLQDGNTVEVDFNNAQVGGGGHQFVDSTIAVPVNAWSHIAGTYDGNTLTLYINGTNAGTFVSGKDPRGPNPVTQALKIGQRNNPGGESPFQGLIDEVEVFNRALTQAEVQSIYDAFYAGKCPCLEAPSGMIAWWAGNDNAFDIQGAHDATLDGAGFGPGAVSDAFTFDGMSNKVNLPASGDWNFGTSDFTIDFWEQSADSADIMYALSFEPDPSFTSRNLDFDFNDEDHGVWVFWNGGGGNNIQVGPGGAYTDGKWHHFALTRVGTTFTLYIDGVAAGSTDDAEAIDLSGGNDNYIGARNGAGPIDKFWNGSIDEVEVFNRGLSADEVASIYHAGGAGKCRPYYSVAVSTGGGGTVTGNTTVRQGTPVEVSATPDSCDNFRFWLENSQLVSTNNPYDFVVKGASRNLVAQFEAIEYQISASASPSAGGTISGGGTEDCGSPVTLVATPKPGYEFVNWTEGGTQVSTSASYTFTVTRNRTLVANFKQTTHLGTVNGSGTIFTHNNQASFSFSISNKTGPSGSLTYTDAKGGIKLTSTAITAVTLNANQATFSGKGTIPSSNPKKPTQVSFTVVAVDNGKPGTKDTFTIQISSPYSASGNLTSGNITVN